MNSAVRTARRLTALRSQMPVPTITQVKPGAPVSIILKADQRTGRQVSGTVKDVLTSGNHPRGIKVRLDDGRIGRVQRMSASTTLSGASDAATAATAATGTVGGGTSVGDVAHDNVTAQNRDHAESRATSKYQDVRYDGHLEKPPEALDLSAYIKPAKQSKKKQRRDHQGSQQQQQQQQEDSRAIDSSSLSTVDQQASSVCPVCEQFRGDEAAVAHHVEQHFA